MRSYIINANYTISIVASTTVFLVNSLLLTTAAKVIGIYIDHKYMFYIISFYIKYINKNLQYYLLFLKFILFKDLVRPRYLLSGIIFQQSVGNKFQNYGNKK